MRLAPAHLLLLIRILPFVLVGTGVVLLTTLPRWSASAVYSVSALRRNLMESPDAWNGRAVEVRAVAGGRCVTWMAGPIPACASSQPTLLDTTSPRPDTALPLQMTVQAPYLAALHRLPLLGALLPRPQSLQWGRPAVYRVQLRVEAHGSYSAGLCAQALLLDTAS